jgi:hypothetical protein
MSKIISNSKLSNSIYKSSSASLVSIYEDSEEIRKRKLEEIEVFMKKWSEENTLVPESERQPFCEKTFDELNHYEFHVDYLLLNSLFLSVFSLFENHLKSIANTIVKENIYLIKPKDIRGNGEIDTYRKYFHLVVGLDAANSDRVEWCEILEFKAIRNAIVHNASHLNPSQNRNKAKVKGFSLIEKYDIWHRNDAVYFRLKNLEFLKGFIDVTSRFSDSIITELEKKT